MPMARRIPTCSRHFVRRHVQPDDPAFWEVRRSSLAERQVASGAVRTLDLLNRRISIAQAILALGVFVAFFALAAEGNLVEGLGVVGLGVLLAYAAVLVQRRRLPARIGRWEESAVLPYDADLVWHLVEPAESAPLLNPSLSRGYRVPGTPAGLGERQALERHDGTTVIVEVIEYEPNRRAVTRQVSPKPVENLRTTTTLEPVPGGCRYTETIEIDLQPGQRMLAQSEQAWRSEVRQQVGRIEALLDPAYAPHPRPPTSPASRDLPPPNPTNPR